MISKTDKNKQTGYMSMTRAMGGFMMGTMLGECPLVGATLLAGIKALT